MLNFLQTICVENESCSFLSLDLFRDEDFLKDVDDDDDDVALFDENFGQ